MIPQQGMGRWLAWIHLLLIIWIWWVPLAAHDDLPDRIPVHFDLHGHPDRYGSKSGWGLWGIPIVATVMGLGLFVLLRYPRLYNYPRKEEVALLPPEMQQQVHDVLREMLLTIFVCVDILFLLIIQNIIASALTGRTVGSWVWIVVFAGAPLVLMLYYLPRVSRLIDRLKTGLPT